MRAKRLAAVAIAFGALVGGPTAATAQGPPPIETEQMRIFDRYMTIVEKLYGCHLEEAWDTLDRRGKRECRRLKRLYFLYSMPGESYDFHIKCRTKKCPATPYGHPPADGPIPPKSRVYR